MTEEKRTYTNRFIPHIPGTIDEIAESLFKNDLKLVKKHREKPVKKVQKRKNKKS